MQEYYLISPGLFEATDWRCDDMFDAGPALVRSGPNAGQYALETSIFEACPSCEVLRATLEGCPRATMEVEAFFPPVET